MPWWHSPVHSTQTLSFLLKTLQSRKLWHGSLIMSSTLRNASRMIVMSKIWGNINYTSETSAVQDECGQLRKEPEPEQCLHTHNCTHTTGVLVLWLLGTTSWTAYILKCSCSCLSRAKLHRSKMTANKFAKLRENTGKFSIKLGKMAPGAYLGASQRIIWS